MRVSAAAAATFLPVRVSPVRETIAMPGDSTIADPVGASPRTMFRTPSGRIPPAIRASSIVVYGVISDGLRTMLLPAASAGPIFHIASSSG